MYIVSIQPVDWPNEPLISSCRLLLLTLEKKVEAVDEKERQKRNTVTEPHPL